MNEQHQQVDYCLDLRELIKLDDLPQAHAATTVGHLLDAEGDVSFGRVYVGSSFCPQSFHASIPLIGQVVIACAERGIPVTISIPIVAQRFLSTFLANLEQVLAVAGEVVDELIANDLGMVGYLCDSVEAAQVTFEQTGEETPFFGKSVVVGRLLNKDTRDPRDPEYPWAPRVPNLLQAGWDKEPFLETLTSTWTYWNEQAQSYRCPIAGIEFDPTHETLLLESLPQNMTAAINGPLCYMSTGQICEYASIGLEDEQAFRPNSICANQCTHTCIRYQGVTGIEFIKLGRTVYFEPSWETQVEGVNGYRQLVSLLKEVRG